MRGLCVASKEQNVAKLTLHSSLGGNSYVMALKRINVVIITLYTKHDLSACYSNRKRRPEVHGL